MGLDTTHGCWHGPYSAFGRFREALANKANMPSLDDFEGYGGDISWDDYQTDAICILLNHSDCDGHIEAEDCVSLAERLEELATTPILYKGEDWTEDALTFAEGLRAAAEVGECVEFQ